MERCSNCGAATRPGAKFCTSCGTRLNLEQDSAQPASASWSQDPSTQETQSVTPPIKWDETINDPPESSSDTSDEAAASRDTVSDVTDTTANSTTETRDSPDETVDATTSEEPTSASSWESAWPNDTADDSETAEEVSSEAEAPSDSVTVATSPSSRFAGELDGTEASTESTSESPFSFPERNTWTWGTASDEETDVTNQESETIAPSIPAPEATTVESNDMVIAAASASARNTDTDSDDPRHRASALADELRGLIWKIGENETSGTGDDSSVVRDLTNVRGETGDFSDLRPAIESVRDNPRDIDALRDLGQQADRLQALLDSHSRLTGSLDDAIRKLR